MIHLSAGAEEAELGMVERFDAWVHERAGFSRAALAAALFAVPALHPLLLPVVGVPSHLLWFVHVLPVAFLAHALGTRGAALALGASAASVAVGERLFGQGYGHPADAATIIALTVAVAATGALVAGFALVVAAAERRRQLLEEQARRGRTLTEIGTIVASIAHELNNPLAAVAAYAEVLRDTEVPAQLRADLDVMTHEARRAAGIARQLLRMVRDGERPREIVRVNQFVERALRARAPSLSAHCIAVRTTLAAGLPAVAGVADELEQVLLNLLSNAEHAMFEAHGSGQLVVSTRLDGGRILIEVADDGPGIRAEHLATLFDPFFTTKGVGTGTGLGLSIARRIARSHGGDLTADPAPKRGATFTLALPTTGQAATPTPAAAIAVLAPGAPLRVLVVDNEPPIRSALERLLGRHGHTVRAAGDSQEALARLGSEPFDAVLCDVHLGARSGADVYRDAVALDERLRGRFVFVTGDVLSPELHQLAQQSGCQVLAKPFETSDLLRALERASGSPGHAVATA